MSVANEAWRLEDSADFEFRGDLAKVGLVKIATHADRWFGWLIDGVTRE